MSDRRFLAPPPRVGWWWLAILLIPLWAGAAEAEGSATLDTVDVQRIDDDLVGIRDGATSVRVRLMKREQVLWTGARGGVGAALTDRRFLAVSNGGPGWQQIPLGRFDVRPRVELGANLALCVTAQRILYFSSGPDVIGEVELFPSEIVFEAQAEDRVAAAVTDRRALGFSSATAFVSEIRFFVQERFESLRTRDSTATVRTSQRLLVYKFSGGGWTPER